MIRIRVHSHPLSLSQVARMAGVSNQRILILAQQGRIHGAFKLSGCWLFTSDYRINPGRRSGGRVKRSANSLAEYREAVARAAPG